MSGTVIINTMAIKPYIDETRSNFTVFSELMYFFILSLVAFAVYPSENHESDMF